MSRLIRLFSCLAVLSAGCDFGFDEPLFSCDEPLFPGPCVDQDHPLAFNSDVEAIAIGAETQISVLVHGSLGRYSVHSTDPDVARAELGANDNLILTGRAEGTARIEAVAGGRVLDSFSIDVARVARTDFFYYPGSDQAVDELAGVVGRSDSIHAVHRSADGTRLVADGAVDYSVEGPISLGGEPELRESDLVRAFSGRLVGRPIVLTFDGGGDGRVVASTAGGGEFELPVRGVVAADRHRIEPTAELGVEERALLLLRSVTEDGVIVAGTRGAWSVVDAEGAALTTLADLASEAAVEPRREGRMVVEVDLGERVVSQEFEVDP